MARFKPGQEVVCVRKEPWEYGFGPEYNEVVTVEKYAVFRYDLDGLPLKNTHWLAFKEWQQCRNGCRVGYAAKYFRPLVSDSVLRGELESVPEPWTI